VLLGAKNFLYRKNFPGKIIPGKIVPGKIVPEKKRLFRTHIPAGGGVPATYALTAAAIGAQVASPASAKYCIRSCF
jgi:hypothetical protein